MNLTFQKNVRKTRNIDSVQLHTNGSFSVIGKRRFELVGNEIIEVSVPLINGGDHTDDHVRPRQLRRDEVLPRERLLQLIEDGDYRRPQPI